MQTQSNHGIIDSILWKMAGMALRFLFLLSQCAPESHVPGYWPLEVHRYFGDRPYRGGHGELKGGGYWVLSTEEAMRFLTSLDGSRGAAGVAA